MIEQNIGLQTAGALAGETFDPAVLLGRNGPAPLPNATGPTAEMVRTFDPAAHLGDAARRGPAMIGNGRPLTARIGGVEVVTIPLEHYAALLSPLALAQPGVAAGKDKPDPEGMLLLLLSLHAEGVVSIGQLAQATGLDPLDLGVRIAAYIGTRAEVTERAMPVVVDGEPTPVDFVPTPEEARVELPPNPAAVPLTAEEQAAAYDAATARGDVVGNAVDAKGNPAEPAGKGEAAYDAERGTSRRRSRR